jgi:hypothetical protein
MRGKWLLVGAWGQSNAEPAAGNLSSLDGQATGRFRAPYPAPAMQTGLVKLRQASIAPVGLMLPLRKSRGTALQAPLRGVIDHFKLTVRINFARQCIQWDHPHFRSSRLQAARRTL